MSNNEIQILIARIAIQDLLATYYRSIDRREWKALENVYSTDAHFKSPPRVEQQGREAIIASTSRVGIYKRTYHFMGNHIATVNGATANSETYAMAYHYYDEEDGKEHEYVLRIRYLDKLRKTDGRWEIFDRLMHYDYLRGKSLIHRMANDD